MNTTIKTTNVTLSQAISEYVDKRVEKIANLLEGDPAAMCEVELGKSSGRHQKGDIFRAEIHVVGSGKDAYASSEKNDLYAAIDVVRDEILRELKAGKGKRISLVRRSGARVKNMIKGLWPWGKNV